MDGPHRAPFGTGSYIYIYNNTLTTEHLGRATSQITYRSTARILHKRRHTYQCYRPFIEVKLVL